VDTSQGVEEKDQTGNPDCFVALFFGLDPLAFLLSGWWRYWRARGLDEDVDFLCAIVVRGVILVAGAVGPYRLRVIEYPTNLVAILVPNPTDLVPRSESCRASAPGIHAEIANFATIA